MRRITMVLLAGFGLAVAAPPSGAPPASAAPPPKCIAAYTAHTDPALPPIPSGFFWEVSSFSFSPDEQWIAVTLGARGILGPVRHWNVLLLPVHPAGGQRVDLGAGTRDAVWSPGSDSVAVRTYLGRASGPPKIYNLRGEMVWTGPKAEGVAGFIQPERLLTGPKLAAFTQLGPLPAGATVYGGLGKAETIDIRTAAATPWRLPRHSSFAAIDSERGLLAVNQDSDVTKTLIVDYATGKVVQSVKNQYQTALDGSDLMAGCNRCAFLGFGSASPQVFFAEDGKTLCEAALAGSFQNHPACWDVDTGRRIAEFSGLDGGSPAAASSRGSRMVLTNLNLYPPGWRSRSGEGPETYGRTVVWDFRSGAEVAVWTPAMPQANWFFGRGGTAPSVAISSLGHYVAESLGDELQVCQLP